MQLKYLYIFGILFLVSSVTFADQFVPEFNQMKKIRCDIEEIIYNQDNSVVSKNKYFRIFNLDDENKKIYIQKAPVDGISYYESNRIDFYMQQMTDDFIMQTKATIDKENMKYTSDSVINYDSMFFGTRKARADGTCFAI